MNKLVKLVLVRHKEGGKAYLYEAPLTAEVLEGDTVVCKTRSGAIGYGVAVSVTVVPECSTEYRFISICADAIEPLSEITGKYIQIKF